MTWGEYLSWSLGNYRNGVEKWEQVRKIVYSTACSMGGLEIEETKFMPLPFDNTEPTEEYYLDEKQIDEIF